MGALEGKKRVFRCTFFRSCFSFHDFPFNTFPFASISIAWFSFLQNSWIYDRIIKSVEILNFFCSFEDFYGLFTLAEILVEAGVEQGSLGSSLV